MQHSRPYKNIKDNPLCQECVHANNCDQVRKDEYDCQWVETKFDIALKERRKKETLQLLAMPGYAREMLKKIEEVIFCLDHYTGNAGTNYNLGMRQSVMNELNYLLEITGIEEYVGLVFHLKNIIIGGEQDGKR